MVSIGMVIDFNDNEEQCYCQPMTKVEQLIWYALCSILLYLRNIDPYFISVFTYENSCNKRHYSFRNLWQVLKLIKAIDRNPKLLVLFI